MKTKVFIIKERRAKENLKQIKTISIYLIFLKIIISRLIYSKLNSIRENKLIKSQSIKFKTLISNCLGKECTKDRLVTYKESSLILVKNVIKGIFRKYFKNTMLCLNSSLKLGLIFQVK